MRRTLSEEAWLASIGKHRGVAIRILDIFEEMLKSKGISIPDEERTGEESEACLYGMTYATLEDEIAEILRRYCSIDATPKSMPDQYMSAVKISRAITVEGDLGYEDIRAFETEGYFGAWDHTENSFVLMPKMNFQFHRIVLETCYTLAELDDCVFKECLEHIQYVSQSSAYTISLQNK